MQNLEVLYYPSFQPSEDWFKKYLLFYDHVRTIVPKNIDFTPTKGILEINDLIPGAFSTINPKTSEIQIEGMKLDLMRKAFGMIKKTSYKNQTSGTSFVINKNGSFQLEGYTSVADRKISDTIRQLLIENKLIHEEASGEEVSIINHRAADLILSCIADNIGKNKGWDTITDKKIEFMLLSANELRLTEIENPETTLSSLIIHSEVPANINELNVKQYTELRGEYIEIREAFREFIIQISKKEKLRDIEDTEHLQEIVKRLTLDFHSKVEKFKKSESGRAIKTWINWGISFLPLVGKVFRDPIAINGTASSSILKPILYGCEKKFLSEPQIHRAFANLQRDIEVQADLIRFLKAGWF